VLYKRRPARVVKGGERLEIEIDDGNRARVRPKDVSLLHPGPLHSLAQLQARAGEVELGWQILLEGGGAQSLAELAELIYGEYSRPPPGQPGNGSRTGCTSRVGRRR